MRKTHSRVTLFSLALTVLVAPAAMYADGVTDGSLSVGPDVTIYNLSGVSNYTDNGDASACPEGYNGTCRGYSVGTDSCNIGTVPVDWCDETSGCRNTTDEFHPIRATTSDHSVIGQNLYRLKDGRFSQIGLSFLKHGFLSLNTSNTSCAWNDNGTPNTSCVAPPAGGDQLGVGCSDFYGAGLNGSRPMGRRSEVQVAGANHPPNRSGGETNDNYDQRTVVAEEDLDPAMNAGARYFFEGHYVVRDDARAGNGLNNASYREATVGSMPNLNISLIGSTIRETPAIFAWQDADPAVELVQVDRRTAFTGEPADPPATGQTYPDYSVTERFWAAKRVTPSRSGDYAYRYEYAIYNMNSDTSADGFTVRFPASTPIGNAGFRDIDHHSGEPFDTSDWEIEVDVPNGRVIWTAVDDGENTNALRWGTLFNFWFEADAPDIDLSYTLDLFKIDELSSIRGFTSLIPGVFSDGFESGDTSLWIE